MSNSLIKFIGSGIKCDNPKCDYAEENVKPEDYKEWLNKPCPKCGSNLLTQADYDNVQMLLNIVDKFNSISDSYAVPITDTHSILTVSMNGTGNMEFEVNESTE